MADHLHRDRHVHPEPSVAGNEIHSGQHHSGCNEERGGCQRRTEESQDRLEESGQEQQCPRRQEEQQGQLVL